MRAARSTAVLVVVAGVVLGACGSNSKSGGSNDKKAEAASAAAGDIPDNQVFLRYSGPGYSIKYPEGWTRKGSPTDITFSDKGNSIHLVLSRGSKPHAKGTAKAAPLKAGAATKVTYRKLGPPDPVTNKRRILVIDRYVYAKDGKVAALDLVTPKGVDNVDAYRLISQSFRWE